MSDVVYAQPELTEEELSTLKQFKEGSWRVNTQIDLCPTLIIGESPNKDTKDKPFPAFPEKALYQGILKEVESTKTLLHSYGIQRDLFESAFRINAVLFPIDWESEVLSNEADAKDFRVYKYSGPAERRIVPVLNDLSVAGGRQKFIAAFGRVAIDVVFHWFKLKPKEREKCRLSKRDAYGFYDVRKFGTNYKVLFATHPSVKTTMDMNPEEKKRHLAGIRTCVAKWSADWHSERPYRRVHNGGII